MNNLFHLLLLAIVSTRCAVRADEVEVDYDPADGEAWEINYGYYPFKTYQTTSLISPAFRKVVDSPQCYDDLYTFFTPRGYSISAPGPMIVDNRGELVWVKSTDGQAYDLVMHNINGEQFLTYWTGDDRVRGHGQGDYYMLNSSYHQVAKISAVGKDLKADLHEMVITSEGTALLTIYQVYSHDLTEFREFGEEDVEPNYIWDCLFQEIDLATNELLFEWRVSDHHAVNETFREIGGDGTKESPWDWYHINSIQKDEHGNYMISARYTHSVTYIDGTSGDIIWILGGKRNMFEDLSDGLATKFANQHHARMMPLNTFPTLLNDDIKAMGFWEGENTKDGVTTQLITMFDNSAEDGHYTDKISHGLVLEVSYPAVSDAHKDSVGILDDSSELGKRSDPRSLTYSARLVRSYDHPQAIISSSQGSMQVLPNKDSSQDPKILLGYGFNAVWTEFSANGEVLCDTHFASNYSWERGDVQSYRVFKFPWVGHPTDPPTSVLGDDTIYVSWNGATEVKTWVLQHSTQYGSDNDESWRDIVSVPKTKFETAIEFEEDTSDRYLRILALDVNGQVIGVSREVDLGWTVGLISTLPKMAFSGGLAPLKLLMLFACNVTILFVLMEAYKRVVTWYTRRKYARVRLASDA